MFWTHSLTGLPSCLAPSCDSPGAGDALWAVGTGELRVFPAAGLGDVGVLASVCPAVS